MSKKILTPDAVRRDVDNLLGYLQEAELAYTVNPVTAEGPANRKLITWKRKTVGEPLFTHRRNLTVSDYITWVETGAYSAILTDGALLQITYAVAKGDVAWHRLAYVPSPFPVDEDLYQTEIRQ